MKKMFIYEPALCCETGVCGASVDPELLRITTVVNNLKKKDVPVERFNLNSCPQEFVDNVNINKLITDKGVESLPATVVDAEIVKTGAYPTNEEIVRFLEISEDFLGGESKAPCCCSGGSCDGGDC